MAVSHVAQLILDARAAFESEHHVPLDPSDIERRSGGLITAKNISRLLSVRSKLMPEPQTVVGLAQGLGIGRQAVFNAFGQDVGYFSDDVEHLKERRSRAVQRKRGRTGDT